MIKLFIPLMFLFLFSNTYALDVIPTEFKSGVTTQIKVMNEGTDVTSSYSLSSSEVAVIKSGGRYYVNGNTTGLKNISVKEIITQEETLFPVTVVYGAPRKLTVVSGNLQKAPTSSSLPEPFVVKATDLAGNFVPGVVISFKTSSTTGVLTPSEVETNEEGIASVNYQVGSVPKNESITSSIKGTSYSTTFTATAMTYTPGTPYKLKVGPVPTSAYRSENIGFSVSVLDAAGEVVPSPAVPVKVTAYKNSSCTTFLGNLTGTTTVNSADGVSIFSVSHGTPGYVYIKAESAGLVSGCSTQIAINEIMGVQRVIVHESPEEAMEKAIFPQPIKIKLLNSYDRLHNNPEIVSLSVYSDSECKIAVPNFTGSTTATSSLGTATFSNISYDSPGTIYFKAKSGEVESACSSPIIINPDLRNEPAQLVFHNVPQSVKAGKLMSPIPKVSVLNNRGQLISTESFPILLAPYSDSSCITPSEGILFTDPAVITTTMGVTNIKRIAYSEPDIIYLKAELQGISTCSSAITVEDPVRGQPYRIGIKSQPRTASVGELILDPIVAEVQDVYETRTSIGTYTLMSEIYADSGCVTRVADIESKSANSSGGTASIPVALFMKPGKYYSKVSSGQLKPACSQVIDILCSSGSHEENRECVLDVQACSIENGTGTKTWNGTSYGECIPTSCNENYHIENNLCLPNILQCSEEELGGYALSGKKTWNGTAYGQCEITSCQDGFDLVDGACEANISHDFSVSNISTGTSSTCILNEQGKILCSGKNDKGQLGLGDLVDRNIPSESHGFAGAKSIFGAGDHICAVMLDGTVKCAGDNSFYQAGFGQSVTPKATPTTIPEFLGATQISACSRSTCALMPDKTVKCVGSYPYNAGLSGYLPKTVPGLTNIRALSQCGTNSTGNCALAEDGSVYCWGINYGYSTEGVGSLGISNGANESTSTISSPQKIFSFTGLKQIYTGNQFSCAITQDDKVKCFGIRKEARDLSDFGEVKSLTVGGKFVCGIGVNNSVYCRSYENNGTAFGGVGTLYVSEHVPDYEGAKAVSGGLGYSCAILEDNRVKCSGENTSGQLGIGDYINKSYPVLTLFSPCPDGFAYKNGTCAANISTEVSYSSKLSTGEAHTCFINEQSKVYCSGKNNLGQLGLGDTVNRSAPVLVPGFSGAVKISAAPNNTCALMQDGSVKCTGDNSSFQSGFGSTISYKTTPTDIPELFGAVDVSAGKYSICALMPDKTMKCAGHRLETGLSQSIDKPQTVPNLSNIKAISQTAYSVNVNGRCAIFEDSSVKCWGSGVRNLGRDLEPWYPIDATHEYPNPTSAPNFYGAKQIVMGQATCIIKADNYLFCPGFIYQNGLENIGPVKKITTTTGSTVCGIRLDDSVFCFGDNRNGAFGGSQDFVSDGEVIQPYFGAKDISLGLSFSCAIMETGIVNCSGLNTSGQLGTGDTLNKTTPSGTLFSPCNSGFTYENGSCAADMSAMSYINSDKIAVGGYHACVLRDNGKVFCVGLGSAIGIGSTASQLTPVESSGFYGAVRIFAYDSSTCAIMNDSQVKCTGSNNYGAIGLGQTLSTTTPVAVPELKGAVEISMASRSICGLMPDTTIKCSGGYLFSGHGGSTDVLNPKTIPGMSGVRTFSKSGSRDAASRCVIKNDGTVYCWGNNQIGQLGIPSVNQQPKTPTQSEGFSGAKHIILGSWESCFTGADDKSRCLWIAPGESVYPPFREIPAFNGAKNISIGSGSFCSLTSDNKVFCFGQSQVGELGVEGNVYIGEPTEILGYSGATILGMIGQFSYALVDGKFLSIGQNNYGQLGTGDKVNVSSPVESLLSP